MTQILLSLALAFALGTQALAQDRTGPLRIEITKGVIEPVVIAVAPFLAENSAAEEYAARITEVVARDLVGTGLFRDVPASSLCQPGGGLRRSGGVSGLEGDQRGGTGRWLRCAHLRRAPSRQVPPLRCLCRRAVRRRAAVRRGRGKLAARGAQDRGPGLLPDHGRRRVF